MIFGRNRNVKTETVVLPEELQDLRDRERDGAIPAGTEPTGANPAGPAAERPTETDGDSTGAGTGAADAKAATGPFDITERPDAAGYVDLGSLRVPVVKDMKVRLDVEDSTKRIIGATLQLGLSSLQAQAFAAPRSGGIWDEIRAEIRDSVATTEGAEVGEQKGPFGTEVIARLPAKMPDGSPGWRVARFIGVDGPRWFLRGVIGGEAAFKAEAAGTINEIFSRMVVQRGEDPHPPRELLPLTPPENMRAVRKDGQTGQTEAVGQPGAGGQGTGPEAANVVDPRQQPPERGPEVTEVR